MKNSIKNPCLRRALCYLVMMAFQLAIYSPLQLNAQCVASKGTVEGFVFRDTDNNGSRGVSEIGMPDVMVLAHDATGAQVASTTTNLSGNFSFTGLTDGTMLRLTYSYPSEFSSSLMGQSNGTSIQFVQVPACGNGLGLVQATDMCNVRTEIITTCFVQGTVAERTQEPTIVGIEYGFNSTTSARKFAMHGETGSIWGLAWKNSTKEIFSSAFIKQNTGLKYGHDAIMRTVFNGSMYTTSLFARLSDLGQESGTLTVNDPKNCSYGTQVGKIGLGGLAISPDGKYLYVINIYNNTLVRIQTTNPTAGNTVSFKIPGTGSYAFALKYYGDKIYVGTTIPGDVASVFSFDPVTSVFSDTGLEIDAGADWVTQTPGGPAAFWLTDLDFTDNGDMLISLADRLGHTYCNATTSRLDEQKGDLMIAWKNGSSWTLEDRSGGKEFFSYDYWVPNPAYHAEITTGSIFAMPGQGSVVATVFDPELNSYSGGLHRYSTEDGSKEGTKELYTRETVNLFGKASGFGDITAICGAPDIEIGNLVWIDKNKNGYQDADESGISGVSIKLYDENCNLIGTTVTDSKGNYLFNGSNITGGLLPGTQYYVGIDPASFDTESNSYHFGGNLYGLTTNIPGSDLINSDVNGTALSCKEALVSVKTSRTSHSFDIGLTPAGQCSIKIFKKVINEKAVQRGDVILFEIGVSNRGQNVISEVKVEDKLPAGYEFIPEMNPKWTNDNGTLRATLDNRLLPGSRASLVLSLKFQSGAKVISFLNTARITSAKDGFGNNIADLNTCFDLVEDGFASDLPQVCDLALVHKVDVERVYTPDSEVILTTTVCNQGTIEAATYQITNYLNPEFDFDPLDNPGWNISQDLKTLTYDEGKSLPSGVCRDYKIKFTILEDVVVSEIVNYAEISRGSCRGLTEDYDFDSTPDNTKTNDKGGQPNGITDNMMDDDGSNDEDDQDPAVVTLNLIDLSIKKGANVRRVDIGTVMDFWFDITNEGDVPVSRVTIVDYIPVEVTPIDTTWSIQGQKAYKEIIFPGNLQKGQKIRTNFRCVVNNNAQHPQVIRNAAEIFKMYDQFNRDISAFDTDSTPDDERLNDVDENQKDLKEDDISYYDFSLICPPETVACGKCAKATTPTNGLFETYIKFAGIKGDEWRVLESVGLYDLSSTPEDPIKLADGTYMVTEYHTDDYDYYKLFAYHKDRAGYSVRLVNKYGEIEELRLGPAFCNFAETSLIGPTAVCIASSLPSVYTANIVDDDPVEYIWVVENGTPEASDTLRHITGPVFDTLWTEEGTHTVKVFSNVPCSAPAFVNVVVGSSASYSISCIGDIQVSLDQDCAIEVTPQMLVAGSLIPGTPYSIMLTDAHGNLIPNATLTREHIGTKVMAKLFEACSGNSCWSFITVEDKTPPISICREISLPCYALSQYKGPFEVDNCGGDVTNKLINETITPVCSETVFKFLDRTYQAEDKYGNKSAICQMRISLLRPDLSEATGFLVFPPNHMKDEALTCSDFEMDNYGRPDPSVTGVPQYAGRAIYPGFEESCNMSVWYTDDEIKAGCVWKILRTWHVYEQCGQHFQHRTHLQTIEIKDNKAPYIKPIQNIVVSTNGHHCSAKVLLPQPVVNDTCSGVLRVTAKYPGGIITDLTAPAEIELPSSVMAHAITYTVYDACLNSSQVTFTIKVEDKTPPTVICKGELVVGLNSNGEAYLYPTHINDGSFDGCGIDSMKVAFMVPGGLIPDAAFHDLVEFGCADAGKSRMVALRVWDTNGNSNSCMMNVTVQDKKRPVITCPPHVTIDCSDVFTGMNLAQYGNATAFDACGATVTELAPKFSLNSCRVGYIERTFVASDGLGTDTCRQRITVENENDSDLADRVKKPKEYEVNDKCSADDLKPENLPAEFGYPVITQTACGMASSTYKDETYNFVTGACFKILRRWTVIDWCEMDRLGAAYEPFRFTQTIKVNNTVPPFFIGTIPPRDTFLTDKGNCTDGPVFLTVRAGDLCTPDVKLKWRYDIDYNNDGIDLITNSGFGPVATISTTFPVGLHKVKWSFEDQCGNVSTREQLILVRNDDRPQAGCLESISISINPMDTDGNGKADIEMGCIRASTLNASSSSLCCTDPLKFSFSADVLDTIACFDCFDVGFPTTIDLWVTDCNGNTDICTVNVTVLDNNDSDVCERICEEHPASVTIAPVAPICAGSSTTVVATAPGTNTYLWSNGATTSSITVTPAVTTTYTVTVTNEFRCTATATRIVTVNPTPNAAITGNNICNGGSTTLTASGGTSYIWNTGATTAAITVAPVVNTTYTVTVTNANGCSATATRLVVVSSNPTAVIQPAQVQVCRNAPATLTASGGTSYLWSTGATTAAVTVNPAVTTTYTVTVTNASGCTATASRLVTVLSGPTPAITGANSICVGSNTTLTATGGVSYVWSTGASTTSINVAPTTTATYTVTATDANGCTGTATKVLTVNPLPQVGFSGDTNLCIGESTTITASGGTAYVWNTGATTAAITVAPLVTTTYTVTVTNANTCTNTGQVIVNVNPQVVPVLTGNNVICQGGSTSLTASGATSYVWSTGATTPTINVTPASTTTYTVTATNSNGCTGTGTRTVTVNSIPAAAISGDLEICLGESTTLTASGGTSYVWNTGASTAAITVTPTVTTTYTVTVTNANNCTATANATVMVDPGTLTCTTQNISVYLNANGMVSITPADISTGTIGACTNIQATVTPNTFFCNDAQNNPVIVTLKVKNLNTNDSLTCTAQVTVLDTITPTLVCPSNLTLHCDTYNPNTPLSTYGSATFSDNCNVGLTIVELPIINLNDCNVGQITRTFTVTDASGNSTQCVQIISVINENPVTLADITFPADVTLSNCINPTPATAGSTVVNANNASCSKIGISFVDDAPPSSPLCRDTIVRTWTVRDTCQFVTGTANGIFTHIQRIYVAVQQPVVTGLADTTLLVDVNTCEAMLTGTFHTATGCNLTLNNGYNGLSSFAFNNVFPVGVTNVTLKATESCNGLMGTFNFRITVVDTTVTKLRCVKQFPIIQDLDPPSVKDFVRNHAVITTSCSSPLLIRTSYSRTNINDTVRTYFCSDILLDYPIRVYFWSNGQVIDSCNSLATPIDPNGICSPGRVTLAGYINTEEGQIVPDVEVKLMGSSMAPNMSDDIGLYKFAEMETGGIYDVKPVRDNKPLEGVSTLDLILMQRHILGISKLTSPYDMIAADINHDERVTASDIVQLRKLILGINSRFPDNTSWRMIDKGYIFPDPSDPFVEPVREIYHIDNLASSMRIDWIGVKIGDVNGSYSPNVQHNALGRSAGFQFVVTDKVLTRGLNVIPVTAGQDVSVAGFQAEIEVGDLKNISLRSGVLDLDDSHYSFENGVLTVSWHKPAAVKVDQNDVLFEIIADNHFETRLSDGLSIRESRINAEYYGNDLTAGKLGLRIVTPQPEAFELAGNKPNPWENQTSIQFSIPAAGEVILTVRDITGRNLFTTQEWFQAGANAFNLTRDKVGHAGILIYELKYQDEVKAGKMINVR